MTPNFSCLFWKMYVEYIYLTSWKWMFTCWGFPAGRAEGERVPQVTPLGLSGMVSVNDPDPFLVTGQKHTE